MNGKIQVFCLAIIGAVLVMQAEAQEQPQPDPRCSLQQEPGTTPCPGSQPAARWSYNPTTKKCETFQYTGCGGNANNFTSEALCQQACVQQQT